jgi:hypothetical protein
LERRLGRSVDAVGLELLAPPSARDLLAALDRADVALVVVRAALLDDRLCAALLRWVLSDVEGADMIVTPKEIDKVVKDLARIISDALNIALHRDMTLEETRRYMH